MTPTTTRRTLLAGGATLLTGSAAAQQATALRFYCQNFETDAATLVFEVPRQTSGRYEIEPIVGFDKLAGVLGKERAAGGERALLEGVQSGELDLIAVTWAIGDYVPEAQAFLLPFLFRDYTHARAVLDGPIGQDILGKLPAHHLVGLAWTEGGLRYVANNKRPIRNPEDLRGLKLRTSQNPVVVEAFRTLGAEVVPMPWGQAAVDALAQGVIDGMETDLLAILTSEVFRWAKYLSLTGHIYAPGIIVMSEAAHDRLTEADRQAFVEAARLAAQNSRKEGDDAEAAGLASAPTHTEDSAWR
jgi:TRAP-type transport system periplasmic protein